MSIKKKIKDSIAVKQMILEDEQLLRTVEVVAAEMVNCYKAGGKVLFCGNGGSAADAQHLAAELSGRFYFDRPPLNAEACHVNSSYITAVANDYGYDQIFSRYIQGVGSRGDVLVGISTSGNSENIIKAFEVAKEKGMIVVAMTGERGGQMKKQADFLIHVPSTDTPRIQESHIMIGHIICEMVEEALFGEIKNEVCE